MEQRERFIRDERLALYTMTELCERDVIAASRRFWDSLLSRGSVGGRF